MTHFILIYAKATALFLYVNSGHYFFNGNKRLATFSLTFFIENNGLHPTPTEKHVYAEWLLDIFGEQQLDDYESFTPQEFAMYNLALITARPRAVEVEFDCLKEQVEVFLWRMFTSTA